MLYSSPLRYPGGKRKLSDYVKAIIEENGLLDGEYVEVYAGGAGVALDLLLQEYMNHIYINDLSKSVYAFWFCVLNETEHLCKSIIDTPVNFHTWEKQKSIQENPGDYDIREFGFSTFFLNRTNRSGIIKGGPIGGKNQSGEWKLDARYMKNELIKRITLIAKYKKRVSLFNMDAIEFLSRILPSLPSNSLIYLDPPYYIKGKGLYENYYKHEDHLQISEFVKKEIVDPKWIISYDNVPQIIEFYKTYRNITYQLSYSAQDRYLGSEVLFFCDSLKLPTISDSNLKYIHQLNCASTLHKELQKVNRK